MERTIQNSPFVGWHTWLVFLCQKKKNPLNADPKIKISYKLGIPFFFFFVLISPLLSLYKIIVGHNDDPGYLGPVVLNLRPREERPQKSDHLKIKSSTSLEAIKSGWNKCVGKKKKTQYTQATRLHPPTPPSGFKV